VAGGHLDHMLARTQHLLDNGLILEAVKELVRYFSAVYLDFYVILVIV
jgi:hypothetical protein